MQAGAAACQDCWTLKPGRGLLVLLQDLSDERFGRVGVDRGGLATDSPGSSRRCSIATPIGYVMPTSHDNGKASADTANFVSISATGVTDVRPRSN